MIEGWITLRKQVLEGCEQLKPDPFLLDRAQWFLNRSWDDCGVLDEREKGEFFRSRLLSALAPMGVPRLVLRYVNACEDGKAWLPVENAYREGPEEGHAAMTLYRLRGLLRDKIPVSAVISHLAADLQRRAESGDDRFFETLGKELTKVRKAGGLTQSGERWLARGWLTLALWECDKWEAIDLISRCAPLVPLSAAEWKSPVSASELDAFERLFNKIRNRPRWSLIPHFSP